MRGNWQITPDVESTTNEPFAWAFNVSERRAADCQRAVFWVHDNGPLLTPFIDVFRSALLDNDMPKKATFLPYSVAFLI